MEARLGFIDPNGKFYPCGYGCHEDLAKKISQPLGYVTRWDSENFEGNPKELPSTYSDALTQANWIMIGYVNWNANPLIMGIPNPAQQEIVDQIVMAWVTIDEDKIADALQCNIEQYTKDESASEYMNIDGLHEFRQSWMNEHSENAHVDSAKKLLSPDIGRWNKTARDGD